MPLPSDYVERVYAGVLGKMIGVYLGRPFEQWTHERILAELGEITYYVNDRMPGRPPLVVTDDDLSGTFTFLRALPDYDYRRDLAPAQIGQTWLNYIVEGRSLLWWGGLGNSTEHTAYLRLKHGLPAPRSGSAELNGTVIAEQIGAQIFIDGWAMLAPGDPEFAADLARRAASVSHDGEAIYGAQALAAMEAQAFVEADIQRLIDTGLRFIPADSTVARLIGDVREWHARDGDWRAARAWLAAEYGYDRYGGPCHLVPNHALILLGLLYGEGDFHKSLTIVNTSGCDTDCNSGNLGCLLGIRGGLAALAGGPDWRGPVADRLYLSSADGGRAISDAAIETLHIVNTGRALAGESPLRPKAGARFHFELPGSVQGFAVEGEPGKTGRLENTAGHSRRGQRSLKISWGGQARAATPTFIRPADLNMPGYTLLASPSLYPGQRVSAGVMADEANADKITARLSFSAYGSGEAPERSDGPALHLGAGASGELHWQMPDTGGAPIADLGLALEGEGVIYLDYLTWEGAPTVTFTRPAAAYSTGSEPWRRAWVNGVDRWEPFWRESFHLTQNEGRGLLIQGAREWTNYEVSASVTPALAEAFGLAARVQGMRRYYALLLGAGGTARLVKALDGEKTLAEAAFAWELWRAYDLRLQVAGARIRGWVDGRLLFDVQDVVDPLTGGGIALVIEEGTAMTDAVSVRGLVGQV